MKSMKYFSYALCAAALAFASCTQPTNGNGGGDKDLVLSASKSEITADGTDKVTFTVKYGEEDVTANASIADAATGEVLSGSEFATETAGSYEFVASYDGKESNKVKVDATAVSGLVLSVDKESIVNDGEDTATFTVTFDGNDVTAQATIVNQTSGQAWAEGVHTFVSSASGEYEFKASYNDMRSNTVKVTVTMEAVNPLVLTATRPRIAADGSDASSFKVMYEGEDVTDAAKIKNLATGEYLESNSFSYSGDLKVVEFEAEYEGATSEPINVGFGDFYKNVLFCRFTATSCGPCTSFSSVLSAALEQYPDRLVQVAIHQNDEYTSNNYYDFASYFKFSGIPAIFFDFDKEGPSAVSMSAADVVNTIKEYQATGAKVGIAMSSTVDAARNVKVTVRVTPSEAGSYLLGVALLEDGIEGPQNGTSGYIHDNTMRALATSLGGDSLGEVAENTEVVKEYTFSLKGYTDNCRVVAYVNTADGDVYATTNAASCPVNGRTDYRFETAAE